MVSKVYLRKRTNGMKKKDIVQLEIIHIVAFTFQDDVQSLTFLR